MGRVVTIPDRRRLPMQCDAVLRQRRSASVFLVAWYTFERTGRPRGQSLSQQRHTNGAICARGNSNRIVGLHAGLRRKRMRRCTDRVVRIVLHCGATGTGRSNGFGSSGRSKPDDSKRFILRKTLSMNTMHLAARNVRPHETALHCTTCNMTALQRTPCDVQKCSAQSERRDGMWRRVTMRQRRFAGADERQGSKRTKRPRRVTHARETEHRDAQSLGANTRTQTRTRTHTHTHTHTHAPVERRLVLVFLVGRRQLCRRLVCLGLGLHMRHGLGGGRPRRAVSLPWSRLAEDRSGAMPRVHSLRTRTT